MSRFGYAVRYFANDMIPMILFLVLFSTTKDIMLATGVGIVVGLGQVAYTLARRQPVGALQWASLGPVAVFGTATLLTRDPRFVMFKPTAVQLILGAVMLRPGWMERYVSRGARYCTPPVDGLRFCLGRADVPARRAERPLGRRS